MRLAWMTDLHLNFVGTQQIETLLHDLRARQPDAVIISGDIGESHSVLDYLIRIHETLTMPVYFVPGNHDYYRGSIASVRQAIRRMTDLYPDLHYLTDCQVVRLTETVALVGHDGLSDGQYGNFMTSPIMLNDYILIQELSNLTPQDLLARLRANGEETAAHLRRVLPAALRDYERVFVVLHSPPFKEAAWHNGSTPPDDDPYLPHFTTKAAGDALLDLVAQSPDCQVTVLCGHTHGTGMYQALPNLRVLTGGAVYEKPAIQRIFDLTADA